MTGEIVSLTEQTFQKFVREDIVVVDFWAPWCGPCKVMEPIFSVVAHETHGRAKFAKVNVDENPELAQEFRVMSIPTTIVFRDGQQIDRFVGAVSKKELMDFVQNAK